MPLDNLPSEMLSAIISQLKGGANIRAAASCSTHMLEAVMRQPLRLTLTAQDGHMKFPFFICSTPEKPRAENSPLGLRLRSGDAYGYRFPAGDLGVQLMEDRQCRLRKLSLSVAGANSMDGLPDIGSLLLRMPALRRLELHILEWPEGGRDGTCCANLAAALPHLGALQSLQLELPGRIGVDSGLLLVDVLMHRLPLLQNLQLRCCADFASLMGGSAALTGLTLNLLSPVRDAEPLNALLESSVGQQLRQLSFDTVTGIWSNDQLRALFARFENLTRIKTLLLCWFGDRVLDDDSLAASVELAARLRSMPTLISITLRGGTTLMASAAVPALSALGALKELRIYDRVVAPTFSQLIAGLEYSGCSLTDLVLTDVCNGNNGGSGLTNGTRLAALLSRMPGLRRLELETHSNSPGDTAFMPEFLLKINLQPLHFLRLGRWFPCRHLLPALHNMRSLRSAKASVACISDDEWAQLAELMGRMGGGRLEFLELTCILVDPVLSRFTYAEAPRARVEVTVESNDSGHQVVSLVASV